MLWSELSERQQMAIIKVTAARIDGKKAKEEDLDIVSDITDFIAQEEQ